MKITYDTSELFAAISRLRTLSMTAAEIASGDFRKPLTDEEIVQHLETMLEIINETAEQIEEIAESVIEDLEG